MSSSRWTSIAAVIAALVALPWLVDGHTIAIASTAVVAAVLASSAQVLHLAGLASLGQAAYLGVGAYAAAICSRWTTDALVQLVTAVAAAVAVAAVIGLAISRTRGLRYLLCTFAIGELAVVIADHNTVTGGGTGLSTNPVNLPGQPAATDQQLYLYALTIAALALIGVTYLLRNRFGLVLRAIADQEQRVEAHGYSTATRLWAAHVLAGGLAGLAGALLVATRRLVSPVDLTFDVSALAFLAAIMAGTTIISACLAAVGITLVRDIIGAHLPGIAPILLGFTFLAVALIHSATRRHVAEGRR